jgi:hypothetical protein
MSAEADERDTHKSFNDLKDLMKCDKLDIMTSISLNSHREDMSSDEMKIICEWLKDNTILKRLCLFNYYQISSYLLVEALKDNTSLTELNLVKNNIDNIGANVIFKFLQTNNTITRLSLANNNIRDIGIVSLENNTSLTMLDLTSNFIANAGVVSLVESIKHNRGLTKLIMMSNIIEDSGEAFTTLFKNNSTLRYLSISGDLTQGVFDAFIDILKMPSFALDWLTIISGYEWKDNPTIHFNYDKLFDVIKYNTTLLNFDINDFYDDTYYPMHTGYDTIHEVLERNRFFKLIFHLMCCVERRGMYLPDEIWTKVANLS